jgi:hypothetical protein
MTALGVALALALFGAIGVYLWRRARPTPVPAAALEALRYVWRDVWGMPEPLLPTLLAVRGRDLDCKDGRGWVAASLGGCVAGTHSTRQGGAVLTVAMPDGVPMHEWALVHEAAHARLDSAMGRPVPDAEAHGRLDFMQWISTGNAALAARGE